MQYYIGSTHIPNELFDTHLKTIQAVELKIILLVIRRTIGMKNKVHKDRRIERAWISQKLFMICTGASGRAISSSIDTLVKKGLLEVSDKQGRILFTPFSRRGVSQLYFSSRLRLAPNNKAKYFDCNEINAVKNLHTIKKKRRYTLCEKRSQQETEQGNIKSISQIINKKAI